MILRVDGEGQYSAADPLSGLEFRADYLRRDSKSGEIAGELSIAGDSDEGALSVGTFNFSSVQARSQRAKLIRERARGPAKRVDVLGLLEEFCQYIAQQERVGEPAVVLRDIQSRRPDERSFEVLGIRYPTDHLSIKFGAGGTLKSYLSLYEAAELAKRGKRVLYVDWELTAEDHRYRLECICGQEMPDSILYCKASRPLVYEVDRLRRIGRSERIDHYFLDSVGYGTQGDPAAADAAMDFCRAAGSLGAGVSALAHITKNGENNDQMPYGSVFWHNSARATWYLKPSLDSTDGNVVTIGAFNRKNNMGRRLNPVAIEVTFDGDRVFFRNTSLTAVDDLASSLKVWERMRERLRSGPMTLVALAEELNANVETLDREVRRKKLVFTRVTGADRISQVALVERGAAH